MDAQSGVTVIGVLLSFLIVFKTQSSYNQFWAALGHTEALLTVYRTLAMDICTLMPWEDSPSVKGEKRSANSELACKKTVRFFARKLIRLLLLHYLVTIEYFQRTGQNAITDPKRIDKLRMDIQSITGPSEFATLYNGDKHDTLGSDSQWTHGSPLLVLYWIQIAVCRCGDIHGLAPPKYGIFIGKITELHRNFQDMDKVDKTQYPFPYAQITKLVCLLFLSLLPFALRPKTGDLTEIICAVACVGFYGLDEVAEILEAPFSGDVNDIDLLKYGRDLMNDLEMIYYGRDRQLETVFTDENELNFGAILQQLPRARTRSFGKLGAPIPESRLSRFTARGSADWIHKKHSHEEKDTGSPGALFEGKTSPASPVRPVDAFIPIPGCTLEDEDTLA